MKAKRQGAGASPGHSTITPMVSARAVAVGVEHEHDGRLEALRTVHGEQAHGLRLRQREADPAAP